MNVILKDSYKVMRTKEYSIFRYLLGNRDVDERKKKIEKINLDKKRLNFTVPSIMCMHCVSKVKDALYKIDGVLDVKISLEKKTVTLESVSNVTVDEIRERLKNIGYEIDSVTEN